MSGGIASRARDERNARESVRSGAEPPYEYAIIVCALRMFMAPFSEYYREFCEMHKHEPEARLFGLASMSLITAATVARRERDVPVVGIDIAGAEEGYPARQHREAFDHAHKNFLCKTVHAGEAYGPESIFQAITDLHAERIGVLLRVLVRELATDNREPSPQRRYAVSRLKPEHNRSGVRERCHVDHLAALVADLDHGAELSPDAGRCATLELDRGPNDRATLHLEPAGRECPWVSASGGRTGRE